MSKDLSEVIGRVIPAPENFLSPEKLEQARKARRSFMGKALAMGAGVAASAGVFATKRSPVAAPNWSRARASTTSSPIWPVSAWLRHTP